jgi:biofilm PGA synthesis N-glycosyltransferase PgaC
MLVVFWACVLLLAYAYLVYPALIGALARLQPVRPRRRASVPTVSLVVVAYNEAARIERRLENLLALEYPRDRLEILVASDGSTDGTAERARAYEPVGVTVMAFETHRGKPAVLNDVLAKALGEVVVLADARQRFDAGALRALVASFADPRVGAVSGELIVAGDAERGAAVPEGVGLYWRYEKFIRRNESRLGSTVGATGAIYAIRRALFEPIPEDTILDDVLIPMRIARRGYRVLFEPAARAYDGAAATASQETTRKVRTIAGNFQLFAWHRWLLDPFRNRLWLQTMSHKVLRLLSPLLLAGAFATNLLLLDHWLLRCMLAGQVTLYTAALAGGLLRNRARPMPLLNVPYVFCLLNWVTVVAFLRFASGSQPVTWRRAA